MTSGQIGVSADCDSDSSYDDSYGNTWILDCTCEYELESIDYCDSEYIPSGFVYSDVTGNYTDTTITTVYDSTTASTVTTTTVWYYNCNDQEYDSSSSTSVSINYCASVQIPTGYIYDSTSGEYTETSSVT